MGGSAAPRAHTRRHTRGRTHVRAAARTRTTSCAPCVFSANHRRLSAPPATTNHPCAITVGVRNFTPDTGASFRKNTGVGCGLGEFPKRHTDHHTESNTPTPGGPRTRAIAPASRLREGNAPKDARTEHARVGGGGGGVGGGLVVAVGLDKDRVTGERTGERALTLARSPLSEVVPERAATSPVGAESTWAREVGSTVALTRTEDRRGRQGQGDWERPRRRAARARAAPHSSYPSVNVTRPKARGRSARALVVVGGGWAFRRSRARQGQCTWGAHRRARPHPHRPSLAPHRPGTMPHVTCGVGVDLIATVGVDCRVRCREAPIQHAK